MENLWASLAPLGLDRAFKGVGDVYVLFLKPFISLIKVFPGVSLFLSVSHFSCVECRNRKAMKPH